MKATDLFNKAGVALESASLLLNTGDCDGACNRAYYAMFDAARGALLASNAVKDLTLVRTHSGLISCFSLHLVKTQRVAIELGKALNKVEDLRLIADYKDDAVAPEDAKWAVEEAHVFVAAMQSLFKSE